jgi:hypothetical protein
MKIGGSTVWREGELPEPVTILVTIRGLQAMFAGRGYPTPVQGRLIIVDRLCGSIEVTGGWT